MRTFTAFAFPGLLALITCQWFQPAIPSHSRAPKGASVDFFSQSAEDTQVRAILQRSCADCHSNNARLPWYGRVSPISWMIARHIDQGRQKLNFSEWPKNSKNVREDIADSIDKAEMPLRTYLLMHGGAHLSPSDKEVIDRWADRP